MRTSTLVFFLAAAAFSTVYITQPVLPVLRQEFGADVYHVSLTVSAVVLGIAISNMPFGMLADRQPVHRILLVGGLMVSACSLVAALTYDLWTLIAVRFVQGMFIPALTTCLAAYLARSSVEAEPVKNRLWPVEGAPVIERSAHAVYRTGSSREALIERALGLFDDPWGDAD